jgi:hypothetical protein
VLEIVQVSGDGSTPLHLACFGGHVAAVELLIRLGADPKVRGENQDDSLALCRLLQKQDASREMAQHGLVKLKGTIRGTNDNDTIRACFTGPIGARIKAIPFAHRARAFLRRQEYTMIC